MREIVDPTFLTALATLITAITALVKVFHVEKQATETRSTLEEVKANTNGILTKAQANQATTAELAAREIPTKP